MSETLVFLGRSHSQQTILFFGEFVSEVADSTVAKNQRIVSKQAEYFRRAFTLRIVIPEIAAEFLGEADRFGRNIRSVRI